MSITKDDLDRAVSTSAAELRAEIRASADSVKAELRAEIATSEARLHAHIDHAAQHYANVVIENLRGQVSAVDDKVNATAADQVALRADLDAHVSAPGLHRQPRRSR